MSLRGEAVVHDGGVVVWLTAGLRKPDPPAVGVVGPGGLPALVADLGEGGGGVHPGLDEELPRTPGPDVVPVHRDELVSVRPTLLVHEAEGVEELVDDDLEGDTAGLLETDLHPATARPVRDLGVAAPAPRDDVHVVVLISPGNEPDAAVLLDVGEPGGDDCSLGRGESCVYRVVQDSAGPVIAGKIFRIKY